MVAVSAAEVIVRVGASDELSPRAGMHGAYLDLDEVVTISFGRSWREDWRTEALDSIDNLQHALDGLREMVAEQVAGKQALRDVPTAVRS